MLTCPESGQTLCPPSIATFVSALVADAGPVDVLDPWVGCGTLLATIAASGRVRRFVGLHPNVEAVNAAELLFPSAGRGEYSATDPNGGALEGLGPFDLIAGAVPFGALRRPFSVDDVEFVDERGHKVIVRSATRLRDGGRAVYVVSPKFLVARNSKGVTENLGRLGLFIDAYFHVPAGAYRPMTSIECGIAVIRRGTPPQSVFVGEVADDPARLKELFNNYRLRRKGGTPELGALVVLPVGTHPAADASVVCEKLPPYEGRALPEFRGFSQLALDHQVEQAINRLGLPRQVLGDLSTSIARAVTADASTSSNDNSFLFPLIASSRVRRTDEAPPRSLKDYACVAVDPAKADARVVARFFDSPLGRDIRRSHASGSTIQRVSFADITSLPVCIPGLTAQQTIVETDQRIESMSSELRELGDRLWMRLDQTDAISERLGRINHEDSLNDWLDTLPFPIASILWTAHTLRDEPLRHYSHLEYFFEGLSEFLAIVLLSAAQRDPTFLSVEWPQIRSGLDKNHLTLERASFGTWNAIFESLAKGVRSALSSGPDAREEMLRRHACDNADLLEVLVSKEMVTILKHANKARNDWRGHGGVVGEDEARRRSSFLNDLVLQIRRRVGLRWLSYPVVLPGRGVFKNGMHRCAAQVVSGVRHPFEQSVFELLGPMEDGVLHMLAPRSGHLCPLLPLVKLAESPSVAKNACYFFNRLDGDQLRYISFHYEQCPERCEPRGGALSVLDQLLRT